MSRILKKAGFTLIEIMVALSILAIISVIGVESIMKFAGSAETRAQNSALNLTQFLNVARVTAVGSEYNIVVLFSDTEPFYAACLDVNSDDDCTPAEQANLRIPMPDTGSISGVSFKGVKLDKNVSFGTFTQVTDHVAANRISGTPVFVSGTGYYQTASGTAISTGIDTDLSSRVVFRKTGSAARGTFYISSRKDDDTSFHYAVDVNTAGKVVLYRWSPVDGTYRWKMQ